MPAISHYALPAVLIAWIIYRRTRRSIGFQKLSVRRMKVRLGFFGLAAVMLLLLAFQHPVMLVGYAVGIAGGLVLAYYATRHLLTEVRDDGLYYRTHIWIEATVLALFLGRIAYRLIEAVVMQGDTASMSDPSAFAKDPLTGGILFVILTYYYVYYLYVMRAAKRIGVPE
ncbi:hypothetical protein ACFFNY_07260 [Paenibacillus hodogayensis]|uniref:DUF1453 family protein n=1 Tax=Paenibacillus hodogayensis TaxID=279208 RepID=A0ABV5VSV5_9BACL